MGSIPIVYAEETLSFFIDGVPFQIDKTAAAYPEIRDILQNQGEGVDVELLIRLTQPVTAIARAVEAQEAVAEFGPDHLPRGTVSVTRNAVSFNGDPIAGVLVDRILAMLEEGFDIMPMVRFLENLYQNPADFARDELYLWLETSNLPITEDGFFLAYKNVRADYKSIHDGRTKNDIGTIVSMPRHAVDDDRNRTCSAGLHFCSASYLPNFSRSYDGHTVLLKINPADVVSIPSDYDNAKGRAWKYEVLSEVTIDPQTAVWQSVSSATGTPIAAPVVWEDENFNAGSDFGKALFAVLNRIDLGKDDREVRLDWAHDVLDDHEVLDGWDGETFSTLSNAQAKVLMAEAGGVLNLREKAAALKVQRAQAALTTANAAVTQAASNVRIAEVARVNGLGIVPLRREASKAGLKGAWKDFDSKTLRSYLINRL